MRDVDAQPPHPNPLPQGEGTVSGMVVLIKLLKLRRNSGEAFFCPFTFRVEDELKAAFTAAAKAHDRTGAQLLRDFMRDYVGRQRDEQGYDPWFRRQVQAGIEDADAGRVVSADEVKATFAARRAETLRRLDGAKS